VSTEKGGKGKRRGVRRYRKKAPERRTITTSLASYLGTWGEGIRRRFHIFTLAAISQIKNLRSQPRGELGLAQHEKPEGRVGCSVDGGGVQSGVGQREENNLRTSSLPQGWEVEEKGSWGS